MKKPRFKIEATGLRSLPYKLCVYRHHWLFPYWEDVGSYCDTREQARAMYETMKDLPEYLE
jgi:hypothetical protein